MELNELVRAADEVLQPERFKDYGPNGLQVEGRSQVQHLVTGVTASLALIEAAIAAGADAILVHHGLFWRGQSGCVTGWLRQRLALLLAHDIGVLAYHLPLDAHAEYGNNAQLGLRLGLVGRSRFGDQDLGWLGQPADGLAFDSAQALSNHASLVLNRPVTLVNQGSRAMKKIAWCSGGAQGYFEAAIAAGADAFLTGELSEPQTHLARESGVAFLACGHHATERYGVQALGDALSCRLGVRHTWIDIDNPA